MNETVEPGGRLARAGLAARLGGRGTDFRDAAETTGRLLAGWLAPFVLVLYLALKGGGYDPVTSGIVGIVVWWLVLLGAVVGMLPATRISRPGWIGLGLLGAFVAWIALGVSWSSSAEQSVAQLALVMLYFGVFILALGSQEGDGLRRLVGAIATAIGVIGGLALLSRLHPAWFPTDVTPQFLPSTRSRLNYPLNYWNGLAALIAIGIPILVTSAMQARWVGVRALAAATLPALALAAFYTYSRGGVLEIATGLIVLVALHPRRLSLLPTVGVATTGSAILIAAATQRDALGNGLGTPAAHSQENEMLAMALIVCAGAALLQVAIALAARHQLGRGPSISPRAARRGLAAAALIALVVALATGAPGFLSNRWQDFKNPSGASGVNAQRLTGVSGNGRYQYWKSTLDENATNPLIGTGPGTFQYWWSQHATIPNFVRNAHSLYFETLGEAGIVGLVLIVSFVLFPVVVGIRSALRAGLRRRALLAGAVASCAAFVVAAGSDWIWQIPVIPVVFLFLASAILMAGVDARAGAPRRSLLVRGAFVALAVVALGAIAIPTYSTMKVRDSQAAVRSHDLPAAFSDARSASGIQPYAATPKLQEALVLELQHKLASAITLAREATKAESTNWRTWYVLSRIEAQHGNANASNAAYRRAKSLDPRSPIFGK